VAVLGRGIALVEQTGDRDVVVVLGNRDVLRIARKDIVWNQQNRRWECEAKPGSMSAVAICRQVSLATRSTTEQTAPQARASSRHKRVLVGYRLKLPTTRLRARVGSVLRVGRYTAKWRSQCGCRMLADSRGTYSIRFR
jgi:hypothetical protein